MPCDVSEGQKCMNSGCIIIVVDNSPDQGWGTNAVMCLAALHAALYLQAKQEAKAPAMISLG